MSRRGGVTLVEVLVAAILSGLIVFSLATAFALTLDHERKFGEPRRRLEAAQTVEEQVRTLLTRAVYTDDAQQTTSFLCDSTSGDASISDRLVFTVAGTKVPSVAMTEDDTEFSERNRAFGPMGGVTEVSLSTTPVGDPGNLEGLFVRKQTPADSDPESGGYEALLSPDVVSIQFEAWDETAWVASWDAAETGRLPEAIRVSYTVAADPDVTRVMVVRLPNAQGAPRE